MRQLYTVYERLMKAKQIINQKIDDDLLEKGDETLKKRANEFKKEKFEIFLAGVLLVLQTGIGFDSNKFEDFSRAILGSKAYLLFAFEKLVSAVRK